MHEGVSDAEEMEEGLEWLAAKSFEKRRMYKKEFMEMAVKEAREGIANGDGGPFGAVVVKDGEVIASGHNRVLSSNDSTCQGERY